MNFNDEIEVHTYVEVAICHDLVDTTILHGRVKSIDGYDMVVECVNGFFEFDVRDPAVSVKEIKKVVDRK